MLKALTKNKETQLKPHEMIKSHGGFTLMETQITRFVNKPRSHHEFPPRPHPTSPLP